MSKVISSADGFTKSPKMRIGITYGTDSLSRISWITSKSRVLSLLLMRPTQLPRRSTYTLPTHTRPPNVINFARLTTKSDGMCSDTLSVKADQASVLIID